MRFAVVLPVLLVAVSHVAAARGQEPVAAPDVSTSATPQTRLYVRTVPPGAEVTIDGKPLGVSDGLFLVPAGTARVSVQFDGQKPQVQQVEIAAGRITRVEIKLGEAASAEGGGTGAGAGFVPRPGVPATLKSSRKLASPPKPLTKLDDVLAKPIEITFLEVPLREAIEQIGEMAGVEMFVDVRALEDAGIGQETSLTATVRRCSLAASLDAVLGDIGLTWTVFDGALKVTTLDAAQEELVTHVFEVTDLCEESPAALIDVIENAIDAQSWNVAGGHGSILPDTSDTGSFLVVSHTLAVQRRIQGFLDSLRRLTAMPTDKRSPVAGEGYWNVSEPTVRARAALEKEITASADNTPMRDVITQVGKQAGLPIDIDFRAIFDSGLDVETPVTFQAGPLPLATLLERMLRPLDLTCAVVADRLLVTTCDGEKERLISTAVYPVDRLLGAGPKGRSLQSLVDLLTTTVMPRSWAIVGGPASIQAVDGDFACLVIAQTTAGHRAVDAFLQSLQ